jgi:L-lysine exporter family protein LysE/ArgO
MKMVGAMIHGFLLALGLILPLGVQNLFIFSQGANQPHLIRALPSVITAALCDSLLVLLSVLGVSVVVFKFVWLKAALLGVGIVFLLYMGWTSWKSEPQNRQTREAQRYGGWKQVLFAASISLFNPHAVLDTVVVIGMNSLRYNGEDRWAFAFSVMFVSWLWFSGLAIAGRWLGRIDETGIWMKRVNKCSAIIIWGTVIYMGWRFAID